MGMPDLVTVNVPHPIGGIDLEEVRKKARNALHDLIEALTMPQEKLAARTGGPL